MEVNMNEINATVIEQLEQLQMLMHRVSFQNFMNHGRMPSPHRGQGRILAILKIKPEISQKELTYLLGLSKQSVAQLLDKLEKSGYVTREPSTEDRRVSIVKLTEEGAKEAADAEDEPPEAAKVIDCLNEEELAVLSGYLARIIQRYEEQFPDEGFDERRKAMEEFMAQHHCGRGFDRFDKHRGRGNDFFGGRERWISRYMDE
jgi:DNA-binding MarR family transcriptional regulator